MGILFDGRNGWWTAATVLAAVMLAGCSTAGGKLAGAEGDEDGQTTVAKPGQARLYLIQGYVTKGKITRKSGESVLGDEAVYYYDEHLMTAGEAVAANFLIGGPLAGIVAAANVGDSYDPVEKPVILGRISLTYRYFFDGKYIGDIGADQYMALDLSPGPHTMYFKQPAGLSFSAQLDLQEGQTAFLLSNASRAMGAYWQRCVDECSALVRQGHRVIADLSGNLKERVYEPDPQGMSGSK